MLQKERGFPARIGAVTGNVSGKGANCVTEKIGLSLQWSGHGFQRTDNLIRRLQSQELFAHRVVP